MDDEPVAVASVIAPDIFRIRGDEKLGTTGSGVKPTIGERRSMGSIRTFR